jgi:hypothetical protein
LIGGLQVNPVLTASTTYAVVAVVVTQREETSTVQHETPATTSPPNPTPVRKIKANTQSVFFTVTRKPDRKSVV